MAGKECNRMKVVIVGGKLQGMEAAYLAQKAGWEVFLIDKNPKAPAIGMCNSFYEINIKENEEGRLADIIHGKDLVIPALEDIEVVKIIKNAAASQNVAVAFDVEANVVSSSKLKSDKLFVDNNIPVPRYWPDCSVPVIVKPSELSGSYGVRKFIDEDTLKKFIEDVQSKGEVWVIQEYLEGTSYSLEVMGYKGNYTTLQITEIQVDASYDCKRVLAPVIMEEQLQKEIHKVSVELARILNLTGIMDIEVIIDKGQLKVLEVDVRLPSQTPITVYKSTGINVLTQLADIYVYDRLPVVKNLLENKYVIFEHISISPRKMETLGEHIMTEAGPLQLVENFFGADEAITNYCSDKEDWVATLIICADNEGDVWDKRAVILRNIMEEHQIVSYSDSFPKF